MQQTNTVTKEEAIHAAASVEITTIGCLLAYLREHNDDPELAGNEIVQGILVRIYTSLKYRRIRPEHCKQTLQGLLDNSLPDSKMHEHLQHLYKFVIDYEPGKTVLTMRELRWAAIIAVSGTRNLVRSLKNDANNPAFDIKQFGYLQKLSEIGSFGMLEEFFASFMADNARNSLFDEGDPVFVSLDWYVAEMMMADRREMQAHLDAVQKVA